MDVKAPVPVRSGLGAAAAVAGSSADPPPVPHPKATDATVPASQAALFSPRADPIVQKVERVEFGSGWFAIVATAKLQSDCDPAITVFFVCCDWDAIEIMRWCVVTGVRF